MVWRCLRHETCHGAAGLGLVWDVKDLGRMAQLMLRMRRGKLGSNIKKLLSFGAEISAVSELDLTFHRGPGLREGHFSENPSRFGLKRLVCAALEAFWQAAVKEKHPGAARVPSTHPACGAEHRHLGRFGEASCPWDGFSTALFSRNQQGGGTRCVSGGAALLQKSIRAPRTTTGSTGRVWGSNRSPGAVSSGRASLPPQPSVLLPAPLTVGICLATRLGDLGLRCHSGHTSSPMSLISCLGCRVALIRSALEISAEPEPFSLSFN